MSDTAIRRLTAAAVLLVAAIAAVVSYEHLYHLAITHGEPRLDASLIPVATDGTVVVSSLVMLRASRLGRPVPKLARLMLVLAAATTLAANAAFGWAWAVWGVILAGAPVVWFIGGAETVIGFGRETGPGKVLSAVWTDAETAALEALRRTTAAGNPLSANQLATQFRLSRAETTKVRAAMNGGAPQ